LSFQYINGAYKKDRERLFTRFFSDRTRGCCFNMKESRYRLDIKEDIFYTEGGEALGEVA